MWSLERRAPRLPNSGLFSTRKLDLNAFWNSRSDVVVDARLHPIHCVPELSGQSNDHDRTIDVDEFETTRNSNVNVFRR